MKKVKKVLPLLLIVILIFGLYGCGTKSPSNTVKNYLEEIKKGENGDLSKLMNKTLDKKESKDDKKEAKTSDELNKKLLDSMKNLTYTINSEKVDGNNAKVNVKLKGPDIGNVVVECIQKSVTMAFSQAFSGKQLTNEESDKLYEKLFLECMNNVKYNERTEDISLTKKDGKWVIDNNDSLQKLLMNIDDSFLDKEPKKEKVDKKEIKNMVLNEPFTVETEHGKYTITIEGARLTDKRNEFSGKKVSKVVILDYSYANESFGEKEGVDLYIAESAFQVLDDEGNVLDTYPVYDENRNPQNTPVGGKSKGSVTYGLTTDSKNLNVTFVRGNDKVSKIIIPIK